LSSLFIKFIALFLSLSLVVIILEIETLVEEVTEAAISVNCTIIWSGWEFDRSLTPAWIMTSSL
jgi:hypothetical protein